MRNDMNFFSPLLSASDKLNKNWNGKKKYSSQLGVKNARECSVCVCFFIISGNRLSRKSI